MIDDLDSILNNVDDNSFDYKNIKDAEKIQQEKSARRSDKNTGDTAEIKSGYIFEIKKFKSLEAVRAFQCGYSEYLNGHMLIAQKIKDAMNDMAVPPLVSDIMKKHRYTFQKIVQNVEMYYNDFVTKQNPTALSKKSKADFHIFFTVEEQTAQRINFLSLKELFLRLREFNSKVKKEWNDIKAAFGVFNIVKEGAAYYQQYVQFAVEAMEICEKTDIFSGYLSVIVGIPEEDRDLLEKDIYQKIYFRETMDYSYDSLFVEDKKEVKEEALHIDSLLDLEEKEQAETKKEIKKENPARLEVKSLTIDQIKVPSIITESDAELQKFNLSDYFTLKGKLAWNTREPYVISISAPALDKNKQDLSNTILFIESKDDFLQLSGAIKRAMIKYQRDRNNAIPEKYEEFLFKKITLTLSDVASFFNLEDNKLFIYHIGPFTVWKILKAVFDSEETGLCLKHLGDNKISRFFPDEFIKLSILKWFETNINIFDLPFDRIQDFNEIKKQITDKYESEKTVNLKKVSIAAAQHFLKTGNKISEFALLSAKAKELFGAVNIPVYQRFVDKSIFVR
ncbi:MAG: hypothetical protein KA015_00970 [Spirochaetes bacterium]|nr:hypothetical protein [Spirochaetota bacterium]